jgi:hypothetical protein
MSNHTETITIQLPAAAAHRLRRVAALAQRPIDEVIAETLNATLPPLLEDVPPAFHPALARLETLPSETLRAQVHAIIPTGNVARYEALQALRTERSFTEDERQEWEALQQEADCLMFCKAYAAVLLKWRGERIPLVAELAAPVS